GVAIIGGGLTGCAAAYAFASAGIEVVLLEDDRVGRGSTGSAAGWLAEEPGVAFAQLESSVGLRTAKRAWQAWRRAALDFAALLREEDHLHPQGRDAPGFGRHTARRSRDRRHRHADGALQIVEASFLVSPYVPRAHGSSAGKNPPTARRASHGGARSRRAAAR